MKEVLTKKFWQDVRKTFYDAMEEQPPAAVDKAKPTQTQPAAAPETPQPPPASTRES